MESTEKTGAMELMVKMAKMGLQENKVLLVRTAGMARMANLDETGFQESMVRTEKMDFQENKDLKAKPEHKAFKEWLVPQVATVFPVRTELKVLKVPQDQLVKMVVSGPQVRKAWQAPLVRMA